ncbi:MAG: thermostable hemolysin [Pseudomonadota bacterium]
MSEEIVQFIQGRYAAVHGTRPPVNYSRLRSTMRSDSEGAALGYRRAEAGPLFLERYLDVPVEEALLQRVGARLGRDRIVEIGCLAANSPPAMIELWTQVAAELHAQAEIATAVLSRPLCSMLTRIGIRLFTLAPASAQRLGSEATQWGNYYSTDPMVCAAYLGDARKCLSKFGSRRRIRKQPA